MLLINIIIVHINGNLKSATPLQSLIYQVLGSFILFKIEPKKPKMGPLSANLDLIDDIQKLIPQAAIPVHKVLQGSMFNYHPSVKSSVVLNSEPPSIPLKS